MVASAERLFTERGFHASTVDDIVSEAGYTKGAVYSDFDPKEDPFFAVYERRAEGAVAEIEQLVRENAGGLRGAARMVVGIEEGNSIGRRSPRGWVFLRQGEVQGVRGTSEVCGLPLRFVPQDLGRPIGRVAHLSLRKVFLHRRRAGRLPFFRRGEQDLLPELRYVAHLQARRGARLDRRDHREPGPTRRVPSLTPHLAGGQTRLGGRRRRAARVRTGRPAGLTLHTRSPRR
jgi:AcrR family transcriptional regulator